MYGFSRLFADYPPFLELLDLARQTDNKIISVTGLSDGSKLHIISQLIKSLDRPVFLVLKNQKEAEKLRNASDFYKIKTYILPEREFCYYEIDAKSNEDMKDRQNFLTALLNKEIALYAVTPQAFIAPLVRKDLFLQSRLSVKIGDCVNQNDFIKKLDGFVREETVESPSQYSVRGGIIDVFPYTADLPYRIEFFGDEIDSIRTFDPITKLSHETILAAEITSSSEFFMPNYAQKLIEALENMSCDGTLREIVERDVDRLKNNGGLSTVDRYFPFLQEYLSKITDYIDNDFIYISDDPSNLYEGFSAIHKEHIEYLIDLVEKGVIFRENISFFENMAAELEKIYQYTVIHLSFIKNSFGSKKPSVELNIPSKSVLSPSGSFSILVEEVSSYLEGGYCVLIPAKSRDKAEKLSYTLSNYELTAPVVDNFTDIQRGIQILPLQGFSEGFSYPDLKFVYFSDIYASSDKKSKKASKFVKNENAILNFSDLTEGDHVVHPVNGIGIYLGITRLTVDGAGKDFIKIKYFGSDYLYVPVSQLSNLYKYVGNEAKSVKLNKLGGADFDKVKQRVKKSCQDIAVQLIELYKKREQAVGFQFSKDNDMQIQFERTFPYEETDDQLTSIYEVKKDMESDKPMDRLLCGDVGYGKTEVALRAAFKAVSDGKQVAYLAPTTVLAQQHYNTFRDRMKNFPVTVSLLSRFRTKKQITETLKETEKGACDIVIGTHRILSKDVIFKDLGLLIVDEEQRFGVTHKEKIKEMKTGVDVLTLSATPIPRTLNMAMVGIRDVSTLKEPPCDRHPVRTFVLEYNDNIIYEAISKELNRNGQVFYLHNRVDSIYAVADRLRNIFTDSVVVAAHGQIDRDEMENIFYKMSLNEIDILVCTTIIETGIDIPNVNTMIIEDSDRFGLSQLYQLRGRVGRSNRLAYCYLTYKKDKSVTEVSEKRLKAIKEFTEFGSGFKIALRDLEIRGAGNILGAQQHGHLDAVGYDMYLKILDEAVREQKGEAIIEKVTCTVDLRISAYIDNKYITDHATKIEIYKKISLIKDYSDVSDIIDELTDRFSEIPQETLNLIDISYIRALCEDLSVYDVSEANNQIIFKTNNLDENLISKIMAATAEHKLKPLFGAGAKPFFSLRSIERNKTKEVIEFLRKVL